MSDPIFVRTRYIYDSYSDYWKLVELAGYPTCYVDEMDIEDSSKTFILPTRNGEWGEGWPHAKARLIHQQLEWDTYPSMPGISEVWCGDKWFADLNGYHYVPLGSHPDLKSNADNLSDTHYDVAYLGYFIPRRDQIRHDLLELGVKCSPIHAWGDERHVVLSNSTAYLHVHQWGDKPGIPALRMVVAAAYGLPVITETCADAGVFQEYVYQTSYDKVQWMVKAISDAYQYPRAVNSQNNLGDALHQVLCLDFTFRQSIEAAL